MSRPGIHIEMDPDLPGEGFWELGCFRPADAIETKPIEKAPPEFKGETETYEMGGSGP
jgi:hypothetical protein